MSEPVGRGLIAGLREILEEEGAVTLHETHISWVLVGQKRVWKVKKPVDLGFLDFSTLARRREACEQEWRLNRRTFPELYRVVRPVFGSEEAPCLDPCSAAPIDYLLEMERFDEADLLLNRLLAGRLGAQEIDALAEAIAKLHNGLKPVPAESPFGTPAAVAAPMRQNFVQIRARLDARLAGQGQALDALEAWTEAQLVQHAGLLEGRKSGGQIRPCHGDLHLGNIVLWEGLPRPFDCIEFNAELSTIDTLSEVAFTHMDLLRHGAPGLAARLLDRYLERRGDYSGVALLPLYGVYRALVRAKVAALSLDQGDRTAAVCQAIRLAQALARVRRPHLFITVGLSGSGKSTLSQLIVEQHGAIRLRADVVRKRLFGLEPGAHSDSPLGGGIYTPEATTRTYATLAQLSGQLLADGCSVVVDATALKRAQRAQLAEVGRGLGVPVHLLHLKVSPAELRQRLARRAARGLDPSEATLEVLERQLASQEPPLSEEGITLHQFTAARGAGVVARVQRLLDDV